jgi:hypothetical protein
MIPWTPKPSAPTPQRWQSRAEILKSYLDSLSPAELLCVRPDYYALRFGPGAVSRSDTRKFNPNQPRVPAGNPDGGQWTSGGNGSEESVTSEGDGRAVYIAVGAASSDGDADNPEFLRVASTVTLDYSRALTGISTIDQTTKALSETLARVMNTMDFIPEQTPQAYGTAVHVAFGTLVRFQGLPGIGPNDVEHSFGGGYGDAGSIRTDVVLRNDAGDVIDLRRQDGRRDTEGGQSARASREDRRRAKYPDHRIASTARSKSQGAAATKVAWTHNGLALGPQASSR